MTSLQRRQQYERVEQAHEGLLSFEELSVEEQRIFLDDLDRQSETDVLGDGLAGDGALSPSDKARFARLVRGPDPGGAEDEGLIG